MTSQALHPRTTLASQGAATLCGRSRKPLRAFDAVMQAAHGLFEKPPHEIAAHSGAPLRTVEYWLSPKATGVRLIVERFVTLIRSNVELAFAALGDDACERIAREVARRQELAELRLGQERQLARIEKLERQEHQEQTRSAVG